MIGSSRSGSDARTVSTTWRVSALTIVLRFVPRPALSSGHVASLVIAIAVAAIGMPAAARAQDHTPEEIAEMQRQYYALAQPGPEHELLAKLAGAWTQETKMWPKPGADPMVMQGSMQATLLLGGRFLEIRSFMTGMTEPVSLNIMGFDRRTGEYNVIGFDVSGTYWVTAEGAPDLEGGPLVMSGEDYNPTLDHLQLYDFVLRWLNDDTFAWEIIFKDEVHTEGGSPFKMVEITATRQR